MNINLTRQQLAILGSLLLAGYLVFCCFGYTLGRGLRPNRPHHMKRHYLTKVLVLLIGSIPVGLRPNSPRHLSILPGGVRHD